MSAYYNEVNPKKAASLRELIKTNLIAPGEVDERSIEDIKPNELLGFTQCHFFAGVGIWSYALRLAGWSDDKAVWTGSCPCQPFSTAGKGAGFTDERHLWPAWQWLIAQRSPCVVFGEQVASKDGYAWLDLVQSDLEGLDYAFGPLVLPAAGFGAPHGRHRIFFVADAQIHGTPNHQQTRELNVEWNGATRNMGHPESDNERRTSVASMHRERVTAGRSGGAGDVGDTFIPRLEGYIWNGDNGHKSRRIGAGQAGSVTTAGISGELADPTSSAGPQHEYEPGRGSRRGSQTVDASDSGSACGPVNGFWRDAEWLYCQDGKYRAVEPGTFPLAYGAPERVGRLSCYGDGIVAQVAQEFIKAYMMA